jgi:hypothetical protein
MSNGDEATTASDSSTVRAGRRTVLSVSAVRTSIVATSKTTNDVKLR